MRSLKLWLRAMTKECRSRYFRSDTPATKRACLLAQTQAMKGKGKADSEGGKKQKGDGKGKPKGGKGKTDKNASTSTLAPMALYRSSLSKLGLSFVAQDEDVNVVLPPGTFGMALAMCVSTDASFSGLNRSDKVKASCFLETASDYTAVCLGRLEQLLLRENPAMFTPLPGGETFRPPRNLSDKLLLTLASVSISNVNARWLRYSGRLVAENTFVISPVGLSFCEPEAQPGVIYTFANAGTQDLRTPLPAWQLDYLQSSLSILEIYWLKFLNLFNTPFVCRREGR